MTGPKHVDGDVATRRTPLVVLALTLVGFAALHAFGSVTGDGTHCGSAPALAMVANPHGTAESSSADHHAPAVTGTTTVCGPMRRRPATTPTT